MFKQPLTIGLAVRWLIIASAIAAIAWYLRATEPTTTDAFLVANILVAAVAALTAVFSSILAAVVVIAGGLAILVALCTIKSNESNILLHAYDLVLVATSPDVRATLWASYRGMIAAFFAAVIALAVATVIARRLDPVTVRSRNAVMAMIAFAGLAAAVGAVKDVRPHTLYYFYNVHVGAFLLSFKETAEALWRGQLIEAAAAANGPALTATPVCRPDRKPPHVILIHQESVVPPSLFPTLAYDRGLDELFRSLDGKIHPMRVETYGGASWLSEFSILTGLSARSFGGLRQLVQPMLAGKIRDTMPMALERCGYRSVLFYPMLRSYLGMSRFFQSIGIREIADAADQKVVSATERDRVYFDNALDDMERHLKHAPHQPLFTFIETTAAHWPYHVAFMPEIEIPGGGPGTHPEMHEYLRRLGMARIDYAHLKAALARRFPDEAFLIVHYGDHQPVATRTLLGFPESADIEEIVARADPRAFLSYFAVDAVNYRPPALDLPEIVDAPFLGAILLQAAGLPLSDTWRERLRLMLLCRGRYADCNARHEILGFHRRLIASGVIDRF